MKFILKIFFWIVFYIFVFNLIERYFLLTEYHNDKINKKIHFLLTKKKTVNSLFLGASTTLNTIIPEIFDKSINKFKTPSFENFNSFNMAAAGANVSDAGLILRQILETKKINVKYVFLGVSSDCLNYKLSLNNYFRNLGRIEDFWKYREYYDFEFFKKEFVFSLTRGLEIFLIYPFKNFFDIKENYKKNNGYEYPGLIIDGNLNSTHKQILNNIVSQLTLWTMEKYDKKMTALQFLLDLSKKYKFELILFDIPISRYYFNYLTKPKYDFYKIKINEFCKRNNLLYLQNNSFLPENSFADGLHLRYKFAEKYNIKLADKLNKTIKVFYRKK